MPAARRPRRGRDMVRHGLRHRACPMPSATCCARSFGKANGTRRGGGRVTKRAHRPRSARPSAGPSRRPARFSSSSWRARSLRQGGEARIAEGQCHHRPVGSPSRPFACRARRPVGSCRNCAVSISIRVRSVNKALRGPSSRRCRSSCIASTRKASSTFSSREASHAPFLRF